MTSSDARLPFTGNPLDRVSDKRADPIWLATARADPRTRILPFWNLRPLLVHSEGQTSAELGFLGNAPFAALGLADGDEIFLGLAGEIPHFARAIPGSAEAADALKRLGRFVEVRAAAPLLSLTEIAILGQAKALIEWHTRSGFCASCGGITGSVDGGYRRVCAACAAEHYPRTDPVVIMLVTQGERCLLAQNRRFAGGNIYSTLAGFIEPGEGIDEAVRREVMEEVGVRTGAVRFFDAQPWPFPFSLMIGCYAEAESTEITVDGNEIIAARWFTKNEIRSILSGSGHAEIGLPRREAIAFHLIRGWADT
jgi:NAD+ diphosphatase